MTSAVAAAKYHLNALVEPVLVGPIDGFILDLWTEHGQGTASILVELAQDGYRGEFALIRHLSGGYERNVAAGQGLLSDALNLCLTSEHASIRKEASFVLEAMIEYVENPAEMPSDDDLTELSKRFPEMSDIANRARAYRKIYESN